jgi:hypothetical protein
MDEGDRQRASFEGAESMSRTACLDLAVPRLKAGFVDPSLCESRAEDTTCYPARSRLI